MNKRIITPHGNEGQTFIEFIFLMLILVLMSFVMFKGFRTGIASRWTQLVNIIAAPTTSNTAL